MERANGRSVRGFAPGSVGNIGPGLDILGMAITGAGDSVVARTSYAPGVRILNPGHIDLPTDPARHTAGLAAAAVLRRAGVHDFSVALEVSKGLPLSGGQGGSAASAVAAAVAVHALLGRPLDTATLLECCIEAEAVVAGRHADNVAPILLGGIVLVRSMDPLDLVSLPVPPDLHIVLAQPTQKLETRAGRAALPRDLPLATALHQAAQVGAIVAALASGDLALLGRAIDDRIAEPARGPLLPWFAEAKAAALDAGALGCSISGSGPTAFALADSPQRAEAVGQAMAKAYEAQGIPCRARAATVERRGARAEAGVAE